MKKFQSDTFFRFSATLVLLVITVSAFGQEEKSKSVTRTFEVNSGTELAVSNRFGEVHINTWDQNRIDLEVSIKVKKRSEARAQEYLDNIQIDINQSGSLIEVETEIRGEVNNRSGESIEIDYEISMPAENDITVKHSYGNLYIDDRKGTSDIKLSYGNMKLQNLEGDSEIRISYSNGEIESIANSELSISYSNLKISTTGDVDVSSKYSNVDIGMAGDVSISNKYGKLGIKEVNSVKGSSSYGHVDIGKLQNSLLLDMNYGSGITVNWISKDFNRVEIDGSYSGATLRFQKGFSAELEGYFQYCDLKYDSDDFDFAYVDKRTSSSEYKGKLGPGTGNSKIKLKSQHGDIRISYTY